MKKKIKFRRLQSRESSKNLGHGCYREGEDRAIEIEYL